ncbi:MAG: UvrD-helicase domain-containing protein [Aeriscardovia sp.]|nr:UvrD-helicase domain-containing protein [Aeriscardovia sp.]
MLKSIEELLSDLNPEQKKAVTSPSKYLLVSAGAGSGKTRVLTRRIAYQLLKGEAKPYNFLAITFTNKAANEMKERLASLVGKDAEKMWICTFHSACYRMLRAHPGAVRLGGNFSVYDADASSKVVKEVVSKYGIAVDDKGLKGLKRWISGCKNNGRSWQDVFEEQGIATTKLFNQKMAWPEIEALAFRDYEMALSRNNAVDFDDLLLKAVELLKSNPEAREEYRRRFTRILVDEYQDTNRAQYALIRLLDSPETSITVVGDSDQAIYSFRGSDISIIRNFSKDFKGSQTILLEQNYRSTPDILSVANSLIKQNSERVDKKLWTEKGVGRRVELTDCDTPFDEARDISSRISRMHASGAPYSDFAVLYRNNDLSRAIEEAFVRRGIPYTIKGSQKFYGRKEIKDAIAYLEAVANPKDEESLLRIINTPARGIGEVSQKKIRDFAAEKGISVQAALGQMEGILRPGVAKAAAALAEKLRAWRLKAQQGAPLEELVRSVIRGSGLLDLERMGADEDEDRAANLEQLSAAAGELALKKPGAGLLDFLEYASLMMDGEGEGKDSDTVSLMTVHASKGLEFPTVFVVGMDEDIFPSATSQNQGKEEEERRLAYVAITRAQNNLFLSHVEERIRFGQREDLKRSRFLDEIPPELLTEREASENSYAPSLFAEPSKRSAPAHIPSKGASGPSGGGLGHSGASSRAPEFKVGSKVRHKILGLGTVEKVLSTPTGSKVKVNFRAYGSISLSVFDKSLELWG